MNKQKQEVPKMFFIEALQEIINIRLQKFVHEALTGDMVRRILVEIREATFEIFFKMQAPFSDITKRYVAQEMFKCLSLNGNKDFLDIVAMNEIHVKDVPTSDLRVLVDLMHNSDFEDYLKKELARR